MAKKVVQTKKTALAVGLGLAGAAAASAAYYFYGSKGATANRKKAAKWANDLKGEVIKQAKLAKKLDEKAVKAIVANAAKAYDKVQSIDKSDLKEVANELKGNWEEVRKEVERAVSKGGKSASKAVKSIGKSVAKKTTKTAAKKVSKK